LLRDEYKSDEYLPMMTKIVLVALVGSLAALWLRYARNQDDRATVEGKLAAELDHLRAQLFRR